MAAAGGDALGDRQRAHLFAGPGPALAGTAAGEVDARREPCLVEVDSGAYTGDRLVAEQVVAGHVAAEHDDHPGGGGKRRAGHPERMADDAGGGQHEQQAAGEEQPEEKPHRAVRRRRGGSSAAAGR